MNKRSYQKRKRKNSHFTKRKLDSRGHSKVSPFRIIAIETDF